VYDRAGRSNGTAFVVYPYVADARSAIREFDGANAKGQPIRLELLPPTAPAAGRSETRVRKENPFDRVENPRSLFDRVEAPKGRERRARSASPGDDRGYGGRRSGGDRDPNASRDRRTDTSKPAPDGIDRYVPGQDDRRSSSRRGIGGREGGRRPGERRERGGERAGGARDGRDPNGHKLVNGRPRKTQEELDAEMDDYWGNSGPAASINGAAPAAAASAVQVPVVGDEDIDMIE
jgi:THO complex subunit 4